MARRATVGVFRDDSGQWWFRVQGSAKAGPFAGWDEAAEAYQRAVRMKLLGSVRRRGITRWTRG